MRRVALPEQLAPTDAPGHRFGAGKRERRRRALDCEFDAIIRTGATQYPILPPRMSAVRTSGASVISIFWATNPLRAIP
jgi:hypothetical protein